MNAATFVSQTYDAREFSDFVYDFLPDFGEDETWKDPQGTIFTGIKRLGKDKTLDLVVYEFSHDRKDPRVTLTRDAFRALKKYEYSCNGALAVFVNDKSKEYRFSLITSGLEKDPKTGEIKTAWSNPRRFSFLLGGGIPRRTPADRLKSGVQNIEELKERFSVETLTKAFYLEIEAWFLRAKDEVEFPGHEYLGVSKGEHQAKMTLRLITRLIFIWFLKEKGLVPKELFDEGKIDELLNRKKFSNRSPYYRAILQNLFFATLNTPREDRKWLKDGFQSQEQEYFRYKDFFKDEKKQEEFFNGLCDKIPFVNGGLFENLDGVTADDDFQRDDEKRVDCFSEESSNSFRLNVPDDLFFGEKGIIEILKRYNFTIEENTPNDEDVALDPELLGRVFENLLAYVNPETGELARKASGSFYTPREIVDYMVSESLSSYLSAKIGDSRVKLLFAPVLDADKFKDDNEFKDAVAKELEKIKVLDPACGSGAFPMGILSKIIQILEKLGKIDPCNPQKIYKKKLQIIRDCIYGVDIQDIAVQISKLRFFISLLCEQEVKPRDGNYGIETLPNLETKIVCADTLKKLNEKSGYDFAVDGEINELKEKLFKTRKEYFDEKKKADKRNLRRIDKATREKLGGKITEFVKNMIDRRLAEEERKIDQHNRALEKVKKPKYEYIATPEQQEWDTILGSSTPKKPQQQQIETDVNEPERTRLEREIFKSEKIIDRLRWDRENDPSIMEAKAVAGWNPYDTSKCAEFFSPKWMFGTTEVFDIIIGNPPYIRLQNDNGRLAQKYENCGYDTLDRDGDIYCLFYERGQQLLKHGGHLCFITSNKWMRAGYGENTREFLASKTNPELLIDFTGAKIFESATVDVNILLFSNSSNKYETKCSLVTNKDCIKNLRVFPEPNYTVCKFSSSDTWSILSPIEQKLKDDIDKAGTPLKDWGIKTYRGILTGYNAAFIISSKTRKEILRKCEPTEERKRTEELIVPILKGKAIERYRYNWSDTWLINTHNGRRGIGAIDVAKKYPAVKAYLDQYWDEIVGRDDQGRTPYNLRNCAYLHEFKKPVIAWQRITKKNMFCLTKPGLTILDSMAFIPYKSEKISGYLMAILNSKLVEYWVSKNVPQYGDTGYRLSNQFVELIPVPAPGRQDRPEVNAKIDGIISLYKELKDVTDKSKISAIDYAIYDLYKLSQDEIDVIESQTR